MTDDARTRRILWTIIAVLHILAAFLSKGYHHPDEYFQIIEFARHKLLGTSGDELAWEFGARIRPWLQPTICASIIKGSSAIGLTNPFYQTLVLRVLAAALGFWSLVVLWRAAARTWITSERAQTWLIAALGLAWFTPYLHARTSSENLATTMMCFAIAALMSRNGLVAGLCAAASFEARFQMGFMLAGVFFWLVYKREWRLLATAIAGIAVIFALGRWVDHWGYGDWTLTPLAYFRVNIMESKASSFGTQPWWWYFRKIISETPPPVGIVLLIVTPWAWFRERGHVLTWATVPFFLGHIAVAHKELRFLFPMAPLVIVLIIGSFQRYAVPLATVPRWARVLAVIAVIPNFAYLIMNCLKPVRGEVLVLESIWDHTEASELYVMEASPYAYRELEFGFYETPRIHLHYIDDYAQFASALAETREPIFLYLQTNWLPAAAKPLESRCEVIHRSFPEWVRPFNFKHWIERTYQALLLECK